MKFCPAKGYLWEKFYNTLYIIYCLTKNIEAGTNRKFLKGFWAIFGHLGFIYPHYTWFAMKLIDKLPSRYNKLWTLSLAMKLYSITGYESVIESGIFIRS